mmetsp:Transcript_8531/g.26365  ORF Transcript_8531/g.26365 Transcript_8531/m.26365 type:complete len:237 (-) Transcript_8531:2554-3264(-)
MKAAAITRPSGRRPARPRPRAQGRQWPSPRRSGAPRLRRRRNGTLAAAACRPTPLALRSPHPRPRPRGSRRGRALWSTCAGRSRRRRSGWVPPPWRTRPPGVPAASRRCTSRSSPRASTGTLASGQWACSAYVSRRTPRLPTRVVARGACGDVRTSGYSGAPPTGSRTPHSRVGFSMSGSPSTTTATWCRIASSSVSRAKCCTSGTSQLAIGARARPTWYTHSWWALTLGSVPATL